MHYAGLNIKRANSWRIGEEEGGERRRRGGVSVVSIGVKISRVNILTNKYIFQKLVFSINMKYDWPNYGSELKKRYTLSLCWCVYKRGVLEVVLPQGMRGKWFTGLGERFSWGGLGVGGNYAMETIKWASSKTVSKYFQNKYFLECLTMVTSGNVTKYAVFH